MIEDNHTMVPNKEALKKRIIRFFRSTSLQRDQVNEVVTNLCRLGEVALFGGMIRDLCFETNWTFYSDVDIVVNIGDGNKLTEILGNYNHRRNAYGGFRIHLGKWSMDVWNLADTWAFANNHAQCQGFHSLVRTTFFNWDAIVFELNSGTFHCHHDYFDNLNHRFLDINLQANPNVLGTVVRTWRFLELKRAKISKRLAVYLSEHTQLFGTDRVFDYEKAGYHFPCMTKARLEESYTRLVEYIDADGDELFELSHDLQESLFG